MFCRNTSKSDEKLPLAFFFIAPPEVLELLFVDALLFGSMRYIEKRYHTAFPFLEPEHYR